MRNDLAIRVEHLSKRYALRGHSERYLTIRDSIMNAMALPLRPPGIRDRIPQRRSSETYFLALNDVGFSVAHGEALGVMGHNGAGKSTLLKILSRITEPSSGCATLYGRVGSLLEVGTGFHPELSGRENIYLSGAILGMRKAEIEGKFDEIVSFAEVEEFIDTPIKHYSTGMQLRLAFAVAAHLQPEILLIDEVLAVGDAQFQRKCLGKMGDVAADGRTVLFVSHNLGAMKELCRTGLVLSHGRLVFQGPIVEAISRYTQSTQEPNVVSQGVGWQQLEMIKPHCSDWVIRPGDATTYRAMLVLPAEFTQGQVMFAIHDWTGGLMVRQLHDIGDFARVNTVRHSLAVMASIPPLWLAAGLYTVHFKLLGHSVPGLDLNYASERRILDVRGWSQERLSASLAPDCEWSVQPANLDQASSLHAGPC
jgi:lipopolysaccharide transport system ATP-binding protein